MKCPICSSSVIDGHICPKCNTNAYVFNKIFNISVKLYNKALEKSKANDFNSAIILLKKSLYFNKNNTQTLNLLGLLYFETGRLGEAVKQWILSTNINSHSSNLAFKYLDIFKQNIRNFEKLDSAVILYNEAIQYLHNKNDDLAIIRLKKAIDINPKFIDALNLLALSYIMQGKNKKAIKILNKALLLDINNQIAKSYLKKLNAPKSNKKIENNLDIENDENDKPKNLNPLKFIITFIFGLCLSAFTMYFLFIPDAINKKQTQIDNLNIKIEQTTKNIIEKEKVIQDLQKENQNILKELEKYTSKETITNNFNKINIALDFYKNGNEEKAKEVINSIDTKGFSNEQLSEYNKLKNKIQAD